MHQNNNPLNWGTFLLISNAQQSIYLHACLCILQECSLGNPYMQSLIAVTHLSL